MQDGIRWSEIDGSIDRSDWWSRDESRACSGPVQVVAIAHVDRRSDEGLDEVEDCWKLRDAGFHTVWVSEVSRVRPIRTGLSIEIEEYPSTYGPRYFSCSIAC